MPTTPNDINQNRKHAEDHFTPHAIAEMGARAYEAFLKALEKDFDFKEGKIVASRDLVKRLNRLTVDVLDLLQKDPKYTGYVSGFVKRLQPIGASITAFQKDVNNINVPAYEAAKKVIIDEIIDRMLGNGLNQNFVQPLRDLIYRNATGGLSMTDARRAIREYIIGGKDVSGKLGRYIEQTAQQSVDSYTGMINMRILEQFNHNALLITGTIIDNSSPQCRYAINDLNGVIRRIDWPRVKGKATKKFKLIPGTTFDNLPVNLLHWGCRHSFYPIMLPKSA